MTIICAMTDGERTWIGSDTLCVRWERQRHDCGPKWVERDGWAIGCAGSLRTLDLLRANAESLGSMGIADIVEMLRRMQTDAGFEKRQEPGAPNWHQNFIIARPGVVCTLTGDLATLSLKPWQLGAVGTGDEYAMGAAWALRQSGAAAAMTPAQFVGTCVEAAIAHDINCGGDAWVKEVALLRKTDRIAAEILNRGVKEEK